MNAQTQTNKAHDTDAANRLMEMWAWAYRHSPDEGGYAAAPIDGNLALVETGNHPNRKPTAKGKETRQQRRPEIPVDDEAETMEGVLRRVSEKDHDAAKAVCLFYLYGNSIKTTEKKMGVNKSRAKRLKSTGFHLVVTEISLNREERVAR